LFTQDFYANWDLIIVVNVTSEKTHSAKSHIGPLANRPITHTTTVWWWAENNIVPITNSSFA